jgi:insertion element IS1 protein InsB
MDGFNQVVIVYASHPKAMTYNIERNHYRQRHWFGRFKRQSIIVSKSKEMMYLTIALFAKFWVNGNQDELVSLFD